MADRRATTCDQEGCSETFTPTRKTQRFCSNACAIEARNARRGTKHFDTIVCAGPGCGVTFTPKKRTHKYHSPACGAAASYASRADSSLELEGDADTAALRRQIARLESKVDAERDRKRAVVEAVTAAVHEAAAGLKLEVPKARRLDPKGRAWAEQDEEVCLILASDWQLGKRTPTYDSEVCERRVQRLAEKIISLARIQNAHHPVREARLYLVGDIVEGEGIFPTQAKVIDSGLYRQLAVNGPRILTNMVLDLLTWFERVHVVGVIGNHGDVRLRMGPADPETNADRILYSTVRMMLDGTERYPGPARGRVTWDIPDGPGERNWFAVDRVGDWGHLLFHGDQVRGGFAGFPWYGFGKKAWGWIDSIPDPWDIAFAGHWHTPTSMTLNRRRVIVNGSTESDNTYAQEQLAAAGHPTQWVGFVNPTRRAGAYSGITAEYWVDLEPRVPNAARYREWGQGA